MENLEKQKTATDKLQEYKDQGFLFHGSSKDMQVLEPRLARDTWSPDDTFNNDTAVFASNDPASAVAFAVVVKKELPLEMQKQSWGVTWRQGGGQLSVQIPKEWKELVEKRIGYVYVLSRESFPETNGSQWKSKENIIPVEKVEVQLEDIIGLGGVIDWEMN